MKITLYNVQALRKFLLISGVFDMAKDKQFYENYLPDYSSFFEGAKNGDKIVSRLLKSFLKSYKKEFVLSTLLFCVKHCATWIIPIITANVINIATNPDKHSVAELFVNGAFLILLIVQNLFTHVWYSDYTSRALRSIGTGMRNSLIKKLQQLSITFHNELKSGALQSKFIRDIEAIETFLRQIVMNFVPCVITVIVTVSVTVGKSLAVTAFFALMIPINVYLVKFFSTKIGKNNRLFRRDV